MRFGFSYIGLLYLAMLIIPNLFWAKNRPKGYAARQENKLLLFCERFGQTLVTVSALVFRDFNLRPFSLWSFWLIISFAFMLLYEAWWAMYFKSDKTLKAFYRSFLGLPVPGATLPVVAFLLLGIYGRNPILIFAAVVFGIGHIGIHLQHKKEPSDT